MANWSKRKVDSSEINKGQEYTKDDNVSVEELNAIVNNSFNAQGEAEKSLNTVKGFQIGTAISGDTAGATINVDSVGEKIILNLVLPKGEKGDKGDKGESGSFGTMDYSELSNKPQINGKELNGNLTTEDLGIETISEKEIDDKLDKKVDKVEGKGLSTNDFTNEEKSKLLGLNNYDDADIKASIKNLQNNKANINDLGELAFKDTLSKSDVGLSNVNNTSDLNKPVSTAMQEALNLKANSKDLSTVATSGSYNDLKNKPTIPNVENFITKDVNNLTNYTLSTGVGTAIDLAVDTTNYKITVSLKNSSGTVLSSDVVDLPLESVVVSGSYDSTSKKVILTLQNGSSIDFSVADLVSGLASQSSLNTTNDNVSKLSTRVGTAETNISNLQSNKVDKVSGKGLSTNDYTTAEKTKLSGIAEGAEVNVQSDWNATSGDAFIKNKPTLFSGNYNDLTNKPTIPTNYATKEEGVFFVEGLTTTAEGVWSGTNNRITSYYDGLVVNFKIGVAGGSDGTTLNINGLGAKTCYLRGTTKVTTHYAVGTIVMFSYSSDADAFYSSDYDANNYAYARQYGNITTNAEYPVLFSQNKTVPETYANRYTSSQAGFTYNPSTKTFTVPNIKGTTIYENGTSLANKYLGKTAKASDSSKLNGQEASYYLNYNNLSNKPTIPSLNGVVKTTGDQTIEGIKNFKDGVKLGNNQHGVTTGQIEIDGGILENPNLNSMTYRGIFHCIGGTNVPNFDHANTSYDLMVFNGGEYDASGQGSKAITQMVVVGFQWWIRRNNGSDWTAWERFGQSTTPNNGKLTIQKNGTQVGTFTANQSGNSTINIQAIDSNDTVYKFAQEEYNKSVNNGEIVHKGDISDFLKNNKGNFVEYTNHVNNLDVLYEAGVYSFYDLPDGRPPHFVAGWGVVIVLDGGDFKSQILIGNYDYPAFATRTWDIATNAWAGWNQVDGWKSTILYSGASNGNLTLADDVENYDYIEIFYDASNNWCQNSMKVKVSNLALGDICLNDTQIDGASFPNNFGLINHYKMLTIRGKNLTVGALGRWWRYKTDSNSVIDSNNDIWIHTILGYKEV